MSLLTDAAALTANIFGKGRLMRFRVTTVLPLVIAMSLPVAWSQEQAAGNASAQQHVTELKEAIAANREKLMKYQWVQLTEVSVKGKVRKEQQMQCRYGPDGKVVKTPLETSAQETPGGLRGKIAAKKKKRCRTILIVSKP